MKKIIIIFSLFVSIGLVSCDKGGEPEIGGVELQEMCGEWYVKLMAPDAEGNLVDIYGLGDRLIKTYNTADNNSTDLWLTDLSDPSDAPADQEGNFWWFTNKVTADLSNKTFSGNSVSIFYDYAINVTVTDGKITSNDTETSGGNTTDGISFNIEFEDDPGTIYTMQGYRRTGFLEDEH